MRTLILLLAIIVASTTASADHWTMKATAPGTGVYAWADTVGGEETDTVDMVISNGFKVSFLSLASYTELISGDSDSVAVTYMPFPASVLSAPIQYFDPDTLGDVDSTYNFYMYADSLLANSLPIPVMWRLTDGTEAAMLPARDKGYFISYVDVADAGGATDEFSPNSSNLIRWFISTPDDRLLKLMLVVTVRP